MAAQSALTDDERKAIVELASMVQEVAARTWELLGTNAVHDITKRCGEVASLFGEDD